MTVDPNNLGVLMSVPNEPEAAAIVAVLAERGIKVTTTGGFTAGFIAEAPGVVKIVVRNEDLARAKAALEEIGEGNSNVDWSQVDVGEPE